MSGNEVRDIRLLWAFLIVLTSVRLGLAAVLPLTPDEAYYWVWSRHLQSGYFDHPFMVAVWIRIGTWIAGDTSLGVRLLGPLSVLPGSWALFHAARMLLPSKAWPLSGFQSVLLLNATLMLGLGAATMTPDTPLVFFVSLSLYTIGRALSGPLGKAFGWWLLTGALLGLAFDSKYTAVLIGLGLGGAVLSKSALRRQSGPWCAILILLLVTSPVTYWNATHHWASFLKQGGRTGDWHPTRAFQFLSELLGGQIGLATPLVFGLFILGTKACLRRNRTLAWLCVLPMGVFVFHAFGDRVQANWPAVVYPALALAAVEAGRRIRWPVASGVALTGLVYIQAAFSPLPLPPGKDPIQRQTAGWGDFGRALEAKAIAEEVTALVANDYGLVSELAFNQSRFDVLGTDRRWSLFHLPSRHADKAILVEELHQIPASLPADMLCRESHEQRIRCYHITVVDHAVGVQLPRHF